MHKIIIKILFLAIIVLVPAKGFAEDAALPLPQLPAVPPEANLQPTEVVPSKPISELPLKSIADDRRLDEEVKSQLPIVFATPPEYTKSLMFNPEELEKLEAIYDAYQEKIRSQSSQVSDQSNSPLVQQILSKLNVKDQQLIPPPPSFYLGSIIYRGEGNALAWVNGKKFELDAELDGLKVVKIASTYAEMKWYTQGYDVDIKSWERKFPPTQEGGEAKPGQSAEAVSVNSDVGEIIFRLKPNQRLDITQKAVREGRGDIVTKTDAPEKPNEVVSPSQPEPIKNNPVKTPPVPIDDDRQPEVKETSQSYKISPDGHFYVPVVLNDIELTFKVDTGATASTISEENAKQAGIDISKLNFKDEIRLADGTLLKAAETKVKSFTAGTITVPGVQLVIAKGKIAEPLLGMSFFSKLKRFTIEGNELLLVK